MTQPSAAFTPSDQTCPIDDYALDRIDFRVEQLREQFDLSDEDQEDIRHDMVVQLLNAFKRFNPDLAKRETFINRVLDRYVPYIMRRCCTQMRRDSDTPMGFDDVATGFQPCSNVPNQGQLDEQEQIELRIDVQCAISQLAKRDQHVARLLMVYSIPEVADLIGVHRCSMGRIISELQIRLHRLNSKKFEIQRNIFASAADVESVPSNNEVTQ